jgi:hypothetical protein
MPAQIFFFAQDLTVEQPCGRDQINQTYPIWEDEEFSNQDNRKGHINGIATESKNAVGYESVGMVSVNPHSKALPKGNQAPQEQQQPRQAKQHSDPRDYLGMEKLGTARGASVGFTGLSAAELVQTLCNCAEGVTVECCQVRALPAVARRAARLAHAPERAAHEPNPILPPIAARPRLAGASCSHWED